MKPVFFRPTARQDQRDTVRYYRDSAGMAVAARLAVQLRAELEILQGNPGIGSPRLGQELDLPGIRTWRVKGFPLLLIYVERTAFIDVLRLLGERQDVLEILSEHLEDGS